MSTDADLVREALTSTYHFPLAAQGLEALARLEARIAEVERERDDALMEADGWHTHVARAQAAEARCERLREGIAEAMTSLATGPMKDGYAYSVLDAALAEEPHTDVPGAGQRGC